MDGGPRAFGGGIVDQTRHAFARAVRDGIHDPGEVVESVVMLQAFPRIQQCLHGSQQTGIARHGSRNEGQGPPAQRLLNQGRLDIGHAVVKARLGAGMAVMRLIRMQHDDRAGQAVDGFAAIAELLDACQGAADRISVVPVRLIGVAGEEGFYPLASARIGRRFDPAGCFHLTSASRRRRPARVGGWRPDRRSVWRARLPTVCE